MGQANSQPVKVQGYVAPGFESVKKLFEDNFIRGAETSAQVCVYVENERVVDLWCSVDDVNYTGDTLTNVFSSTKSLTAIAMAALQDQGLLSYDEKITKYWPEFGQNGKENVTVADLMRHESGLAQLNTPVSLENTLRENIKKNAIGAIIETDKQEFPADGKREYHAITRGWIANEIFRRVDKKNRTIGEFLSQEIAGPLDADIYVGVTDDKLGNYVPVMEAKITTIVKESLKKSFGMTSAVDMGFTELLTLINNFRKLQAGVQKPALGQYKDHDMKKLGPVFNIEVMRQGETSSANGNCSARGLAKIASAMANKGKFGNVQVLSPSGWEALHKNPTSATIFGLLNTTFTQGGVNKFGNDSLGRDGFYGWFGYGGSVFQWHPELKIGFAYAPSLLCWHDMTNNKGALLQQQVVKCVTDLKKK